MKRHSLAIRPCRPDMILIRMTFTGEGRTVRATSTPRQAAIYGAYTWSNRRRPPAGSLRQQYKQLLQPMAACASRRAERVRLSPISYAARRGATHR